MLTVQNTEAIRRIEEAIGYTFHDKRLLVQVLTRKTYLKIDPEAPDNEVLEFYGDTLMNYHVTNYFMSKYAHMLDDGLFFMRTVEQFTDMRSHYVCNRYLTDRVKAMGLARYMRAQNREAELRRDGEKAYADVFESLVGAIYLDSYQNDNLIRAFILRQLGIEPKRLPADVESFDYDSLSTPIPSLSDYQSPAVEEPDTEIDVPANIPSDPIFSEAAPVEVAPMETEASVEAVAPESRPDEPIAEIVPAAEPIPTPRQEALASLCEALGYELPTYGETPPNAPNARPVAACTLKYKDAKGKLVKISLNDSGRTLAEATEKVAAKMLKRLEKQVADAAVKEAQIEEKVETISEEAVAPAAVEAPAEIVATVEAVPAVEIVHETAAGEDEAAPEVQPVDLNPAEAQPVAEPAVPTEDPAETTVEPAAEPTAEESVVPAAEAVPAEDPAPAEEDKTQKPVKPVKEKKAPARKPSPKSKKAEKPAEAAVTEAAPEAAIPSEPDVEASPEEAKPSKGKKTPAKKKPTPKADKAEEAAPATEAAPAEEAKPVKKRAPAKKKPASGKPKQAESTDTQTE